MSLLGLIGFSASPSTVAVKWPDNVFTVGTFNGSQAPHGQSFSAIQSAVDAAETWARAHTPTGPGAQAPATYVLVGPGDYKTQPAGIVPSPTGAPPAGVLITEPNLWLVGMNRNTVIVDGTHDGPPCSTNTADQNLGTGGSGLNGIMIWKAAGVWVENLTACNFLGGNAPGGSGNEVWWNGGANSGSVFPTNTVGAAGAAYWGEYLTATSTYYNGEATAAQYGIFSSNWNGGVDTKTNANTGLWEQTYASNFNDSGYYIGACQQVCNQTVDNAWSEYNALGYSGSNSGGRLLIQNSQFDNNEDGFDTNSQNGDNPPPQNGACPPGVKPPTTPGATTPPTTCWVFFHNSVHDNNNPNVPTAGSAAAGPVGTGMSLSGARNDTVIDNTFENNGAWGTILVPYPDSGPPCTGGTMTPDGTCIFDEYGDAIVDNGYAHNGSFGNPTNGDIGAANFEPGPTDCFFGNQDENGLTTSPPLAQLLYHACTGLTVPPDLNVPFLDEVACDSGSISLVGPVMGSTLCLPGSKYPRRTEVAMHALPGARSGTWNGQPVPAIENPSSATQLTTDSVQDLCKDLPLNPWCDSTR